MPNYCYHHMECLGSKANIAALKRQLFTRNHDVVSKDVVVNGMLANGTSGGDIESVQFDFNRIIAMPKDLLVDLIHPLSAEASAKLAANKAKHGYPSWYGWSIEQWGTKWNALNTQILGNDDTYLILSFETAWTPAEPVYRELVRKFPKILFSIAYIDEGYGFAGIYRGFAGQLNHKDHTADIEVFAEKHFGWTTDDYDPLSHEYDREAYEHHSHEKDTAVPYPSIHQPPTYFK